MARDITVASIEEAINLSVNLFVCRYFICRPRNLARRRPRSSLPLRTSSTRLYLAHDEFRAVG
jgi:hypothetical protein